jgi:hypothetical protein
MGFKHKNQKEKRGTESGARYRPRRYSSTPHNSLFRWKKTRKMKVKISMFFVHSLIDKTLLHLYKKNRVKILYTCLPRAVEI